MNNETQLKQAAAARRAQRKLGETFDANRTVYALVQARIQELMVEGARREANGGARFGWADVGTENAVVDKLAEVAAMLGDRSFVDALGIKY